MNRPRQTDRYYNDNGEVGYIVSPGYGMGWYSSNGDRYPECATDPTLIRLVLNMHEWINANSELLSYTDKNWDCSKNPEIQRRHKEIMDYAKAKWPDAYWSAHELRVQWAPSGYMVSFEEFDGNESAYSYKSDDLLL